MEAMGEETKLSLLQKEVSVLCDDGVGGEDNRNQKL